MKIKFLGSGSAFVLAEENYHSNILFEKTKEIQQFSGSEHNTVATETELVTKRLLMDAGTSIAESLNQYGLIPTDIDSIFVSHLHGDHVHGLEYLGFKTYFIPEFGTRKPKIIGNARLLTTVWDNVLKGTMGSLNGERAELSTYFDLMPLKPRSTFNFMGAEFQMIQVPHVIDDVEEVPAYGLKFADGGVKVFVTGDCQFDFWRMIGQYEDADIIFHDCEMMTYPNSVHAQFSELKELPEKYKAKMWLYHYMLYGRTFEELEADVLEAGFAGLVKRGQEFDTENIRKEFDK